MPPDIDPNYLRRFYLFSALDDQQIAQVMRTMSVVRLGEGQILFEQGSECHSFYAVRSGLIKLFRLSPQGGEKIYELVAPGRTFAEAIMFMEQHTYPVCSQALAATEVLSFPHSTFSGLLKDSVETCFRVMGDVSMRLRKLVMEVDQLTLQNATMRLINYLQNEPLPASGEANIDIELNIPKSILASRLSIQPETFSRILKKLKDQGLIEVSGKTIHVLDMAKLRDFSNL